jgi:ribosome maturation factor RimP
VGLCPLFFSRQFISEERSVSGKEMKEANRAYRGKIRELIEPVLEDEDMELVDVECLRMKTRWIVRIFMDKEGGVTLDDCTEISHQVGDILDIHDIPPGPYTLEVSSPGLDRPLAKDKDFMQYRGCHVRVKADQKIDGIKNFQGKLVDYLDENGRKILIVDVAGRTYRIPRDLVAKAHLEYEF